MMKDFNASFKGEDPVQQADMWAVRCIFAKWLTLKPLFQGAEVKGTPNIFQVQQHFGFGPLCTYLSINYLDNFLSAYELPKHRAWTMQLLAVGCLSLATKMEETDVSDVPFSLDLQVGESKYIFEAKTIQRMELLVLSTLRWRMQAITPFSFIDYFLYKINDDQSIIGASILQSIQLILHTVRGIDSLEFRPSEIAAAVVISVLGEGQTVHTEKAISVLIQLVEKRTDEACSPFSSPEDGLHLYLQELGKREFIGHP